MIEVTILNYLLLALPVDVALESPNPHRNPMFFLKNGQ